MQQFPLISLRFTSSIFTSHVSARGNIFRSVCVSVCLRCTGWAVGPTDIKFGACIKGHHISKEFEGQGRRSKVKVSKVKNVKIPVFSLVSEKVVQGQGHEGKGHKGQGSRPKSQG